MATITIQEYKKALNSLEVALQFASKKTDETEFKIARDACIQRFEFCIELAWKTSARLMGTNSTAPKTVLREMARNDLIQDPELWFRFIQARNDTSHSYDEEVAKEVYEVVHAFLAEGKKLKEALEKL